MKALLFESFQAPLSIQNVPDPTPSPDGVVIAVKATGLCLSDWHGWMGHDDDIVLPHVPGHEYAGVITAVGKTSGNGKPATALPFRLSAPAVLVPNASRATTRYATTSFNPVLRTGDLLQNTWLSNAPM